MGGRLELLQGDCRSVLPTLEAGSVQCCITSPPYWGLRDYGCNGQLGLESTPAEYVAKMVEVFRQVWRVLKDDGTLWVNMGDSYAQSGGCMRGEEETKEKATVYVDLAWARTNVTAGFF
jgi:site-specific DNA-methyltransferase (adenine-specific)/site-specific DNA-methyltransferase (cytosine-N4-specific)